MLRRRILAVCMLAIVLAGGEIARDASSTVPADVKVGDKVTITYRMTATTVVVQAATMAKPAAAKPIHS